MTVQMLLWPSLLAAGEPAPAGHYFPYADDLNAVSGLVFVLLLGIIIGFLLRPLLGLLGGMETNVISRLREAEIAGEELERLRWEKEELRKQLVAEGRQLVAEAQRDAETTQREIVDRAHAEAERLKTRVERELDLTRQAALQDLWRTAATLSTQMAEQLLQRKLDHGDHQRLIGDAIDRIAADRS